MGVVPLEHQLRVPLHAKNLGVVAHDHGFNQSIRRVSGWHQVGGEVSNGLVMERIHAKIVVPKNWKRRRFHRGQFVANC